MKTVKPDEKLLKAIQAAKAKQPDIDVIAEYRRAESVMEAVARIERQRVEVATQFLEKRRAQDVELKEVRACCKHWMSDECDVCKLCGEWGVKPTD